MNIVLTCYLTQRPDPQRGTLWPVDDDATVCAWIESVRRCGLTAVIFHDELSDAFTSRWTRDGVRFERVNWHMEWSALEERIRIYRDWLQDNECDFALAVDLADVEFYRDPFPLMTDTARLYIGSEMNLLGSTCVAEWSRRAYGSVLYPNKPLLNAGIIGGGRAMLVTFFNCYLAELERALARTQPPVDMAAFNRLIYRDRLPFVTGYPLHTLFRMAQGEASGAAIRHK